MKTSKSFLKKKHRFFICYCDQCSAEFERRADKNQFSLCCKCTSKQAGLKRSTHGENNANSRLYYIWSNMKRRCKNPTTKEKKNYCNISLCKEWETYLGFKKWALCNGYNDTLTIDRIDNQKGYYPSNCRFVDYSTQNANKRMTNKNTTGYIGVYDSAGKFRACVDWKNKRIELGRFDDQEEAARVRDEYIIDNNLPHTLNFK